MALFDAVTKQHRSQGGHILRHAGGAIYGVDHGLTLCRGQAADRALGLAGEPLGGRARECLTAWSPT